jgi:hypothetical protein
MLAYTLVTIQLDQAITFTPTCGGSLTLTICGS